MNKFLCDRKFDCVGVFQFVTKYHVDSPDESVNVVTF